MDMHDQPTEAWGIEGFREANGVPASPAFPPGEKLIPPPATPASRQQRAGVISRRKLFLGAAGAGVAIAAGAAAAAAVVQYAGPALLPTTASQPSGATTGMNTTPRSTPASIGHLLRRAGFGTNAHEMATYMSLGYAGSVDRLLNYQQVSDDAMENRLSALKLDLNVPQKQQQWWLLRMAWSQRPLLEKMTLFWHGVLTSSYRKVGGKQAYMRMITQNNFLRSHAFDTFDNILLGITADPAMLVYLDLTKSTTKSPNENYARELMELFTLGLGNYTQQDVYEGAAALTGWHVIGSTTSSHYLPQNHSDLEKVYLGQRGNFTYKDIIRILANHPATPKFIGRRLFSFFAYENPSDDDLKPLVDAYTQSNHNMGAVMRALLLSPQFTSAKAYRARLKSPTEFVVGVYRALEVDGDGSLLPNQTTLIGQTLLDPPNVAGWPGDKVSSAWLNSGTWMARLNYINQILLGRQGRVNSYRPLDLQGIITANHLDTPEHFVDYFVSFLLDGTLDPSRKESLVSYFTATESGDSKARITLTNGKSYALSRVRGTLYLILSLPEYQLN